MAEILNNLSFDEYRQIRALNQSTLKLMDTDEEYGATPAHAKAAFDGKLQFDETKTLRMGRAEHCWIVEGEEAFRKSYLIAPARCEAIKKGDGQRCTMAPKLVFSEAGQDHWFCGTKGHAPETAIAPPNWLTETDLDRIKAMADAVHRHEIGSHCRRPGWSECTIVYDVDVSFPIEQCPKCEAVQNLSKTVLVARVPAGGMICRKCGESFAAAMTTTRTVTLKHKTRIDRLAGMLRGLPMLVIDMKRMQVLEGRRHQRETVIRRYGWDVQTALYTESVRLAYQVDRCDWIWVFVEEKYPHDIVWFQCDRDTLAVGRHKLQRYRQEWALCELTNDWPGYCVGQQAPGGLPERYVESYSERHGLPI